MNSLSTTPAPLSSSEEPPVSEGRAWAYYLLVVALSLAVLPIYPYCKALLTQAGH